MAASLRTGLTPASLGMAISLVGGLPPAFKMAASFVIPSSEESSLLGVERVETKCTAARMLVSGSRALLDPSALLMLPTEMFSGGQGSS
jgi:hypothetical protein